MRKLIIGLLLCLLVGLVLAEDLVINGDFDDQTVGANGWHSNWWIYYETFDPADPATVAMFGWSNGTSVHQDTGHVFGNGTTTFVMKIKVRGADGWTNLAFGEGAELAIFATVENDPCLNYWTELASSDPCYWYDDTDPCLWTNPNWFLTERVSDSANINVTPWFEYQLVYDFVADVPEGTGIGVVVLHKDEARDGVNEWGWTQCDWVQLIPLRAENVYPPHDTAPLDNIGEAGDPNGPGEDTVKVTLQWDTAKDVNGATRSDVTAHYLYFQENDPNFVGAAPIATIAAGTNSYTIRDLEYASVYYWKVEESVSGSAYDNVATIDSTTWCFESLSALAVVTDDPNDILVPVGGTAVFQVTATSPTTITDYEWYTSDDEVVGGDTLFDSGSSTGVFTNAQETDGGKFVYCAVINADGPSYSDFALLEVHRLMGHWMMQDNMSDSSGNGYTGVMAEPNELATPDDNYNTGIDGQAMEFFDDNQVMEAAGSEEDFNNYHLGLTASAWIKTSDGGWQIIAGKQDRIQDEFGQNYTYGWSLQLLPTGEPQLTVSGGAEVTATGIVDDGEWYLVTGTYDGSAAKIYIDGELDSESAPSTAVPAANVQPLQIGGQLSSIGINLVEIFSWDGLADDVRIYNYALSPAQVMDLYNGFIEPDKSVCLSQSVLDVSGPTGEPDCRVDIYDIAQMGYEWMGCGYYPACP